MSEKYTVSEYDKNKTQAFADLYVAQGNNMYKNNCLRFLQSVQTHVKVEHAAYVEGKKTCAEIRAEGEEWVARLAPYWQPNASQ
jgi:hypothetical protein